MYNVYSNFTFICPVNARCTFPSSVLGVQVNVFIVPGLQCLNQFSQMTERLVIGLDYRFMAAAVGKMLFNAVEGLTKPVDLNKKSF